MDTNSKNDSYFSGYTKPKIAIMLDENTSKGGKSYELPKNYVQAITRFGATPYCIPYCADFVDSAVREFDGFFAVGGNVGLPKQWYIAGQSSPYPLSERTAIEIGIMQAFLKADKPVLGACNGMQVLAGIHGCLLRSDLGKAHQKNHPVDLMQGTRLIDLVGTFSLAVNSRHNECIAAASSQVVVCATSDDGVIEAIDIPDKKFAFGLQWHQEDFWQENHPGNKIFSEFIRCCL